MYQIFGDHYGLLFVPDAAGFRFSIVIQRLPPSPIEKKRKKHTSADIPIPLHTHSQAHTHTWGARRWITIENREPAASGTKRSPILPLAG